MLGKLMGEINHLFENMAVVFILCLECTFGEHWLLCCCSAAAPCFSFFFLTS